MGSNELERWVAVVSGGYHPSGDPNDHASYSATATEGRSIWVLDMETGIPLAERKFDTAGNCANPAAAVNTTAERQMCFALSATPAVYDSDGDGFADVIYAGDLGGNMWKWVIKDPLQLSDATTASTPATDWPFRKWFSAPIYPTSGSPQYYKSIFFPPAGTKKNGKVWIAFGTGERNDLLYMSDATTPDDNNRFYVVEDTDIFEQGAPAQSLIGESNLTNLTNTSTCGSVGNKGYYLVGSEGEKWVTNVDIFVGYVIANSYVPQPSTDPCEIGGLAYLWAFKVECGQGLFTDASGNPDRTLDLGAGLPTDPRVTVGANGDTSNRLIISKQGGDIINIDAPPGFPGSGMFYWRELLK